MATEYQQSRQLLRLVVLHILVMIDDGVRVHVTAVCAACVTHMQCMQCYDFYLRHEPHTGSPRQATAKSIIVWRRVQVKVPW